MATLEGKKAIQEDELQAIIAIFDKVEDRREKDVWKVNRPPEVLVECTPQSSDSTGATSEDYVSVKLIIKLTDGYPDEVPTITLEEPMGLSDKHMEELRSKLVALCNHLIGQEMMFELVNCTQSYLYANNKPPAKSFYDQMITNKQKEIEEKTRRAEEIERQKQIEEDLEIEAELEKQQLEIKEENRKRRQARKMSESEESRQGVGTVTGRPSSVSPMRQHSDSTSSNDSQAANRIMPKTSRSTGKCPSDHSMVKDLSFGLSKTQYQVLRGHCMYHDPAGNTLFSAFDTARGIPLSVQQWTLDFTEPKVTRAENLTKCRKLLNAAEQELAKVLKLQDNNLIHYLSMQFATEGAKIIVMVLTEPRLGLSLTDFVNSPYKMDTNTITLISTQLVQSILYLHNKQIVHKDIKPAVVYVDNRTVRLADFCLYRRLNEIQQAATAGNLDLTASVVRRGQKEDVFRLGMTILFILTQKFDPDERMPAVPPDTNKDLKDFLNKCFIIDERTRWSAAQLSDHAFLRPQHDSDDTHDTSSINEIKEKTEDEDQDLHFEAIILRDTSGTSRLASEFQILGIIGRGGFGEVLKVRNKLDRCLYAIKRITLNPKSKMLNKRITREVKLLSRLNHENVVRYYNSWIETSDQLAETDMSTTETNTTTSTESADRKKKSLFDVDSFTSVERNAPGKVDQSVTWSLTSSDHNSVYSRSTSDDSSSDDDDLFGHSLMHLVDSDSESVVFDGSSNAAYELSNIEESYDSEATKVQKKSPPKPAEASSPLHTQFMYIQMEYCEKNTLRQAIDTGLHENSNRVWRLFREMIEGLLHLHEQGMIHRDLKPVNIFLDSNDHVKIGDFGLATTALIAKQLPEEGFAGSADQDQSIDTGLSQSTSIGDGRHTGRVGTLLYVSPEIKMSHGKTSYSQKVDIYSLGIIFFEMCYRPLTTLMERDKIIGNIRRPDIIFPKDFMQETNAKQIAILKLILEHDSSKRPSSAELLQSEYLPQMEEEEINERFRQMLANPQTKSYKKMISTIFNQPSAKKFDFAYDNDVHKGVNITNLLNRQRARSRIEPVFSKHGAVELDLPLMLPKLAMYESNTQNVTFMDHAGNLVSLPFDLRVPFARFAARNDINTLKRYSISRVFRERKPHGIQPQEHYLCTFDIISPSKESIIADAEVLSVIQQILNAFPYLKSKGYTIHMNHALLIKAILLYCGLPEDQHAAVLAALAQPKTGDKDKSSVYSRLQNLSINDQTASQICTFIEMCEPFGAVSGFLRRITKSGQQAGSLAKTALHEIETLISYSTALGVVMPVVVNLGFIYEIQNSSGVMYQIGVESSSTKHKTGLDVIAGGYRYDKLVNGFRRGGRPPTLTEPTAVGMSMMFDKLVHAVWLEKSDTNLMDVVLFCIGKSSIHKEWLKLAQEFWSNGIRTEILSDASMEVEKIEKACKELGAKYLVTLTDCEPGQAKLSMLDKEPVIEKRYRSSDIVEEILKRLHVAAPDKHVNRNQQGDHLNIAQTASLAPEKSERGLELISHTFQCALPITLITAQETRQSLKARSKTETMIHNQLNNTVLCLLKKASEAEVVAFDLGLAEVKVIAATYGDSEEQDQFDHNSNVAMERQESARHRKYMSKIFNRLRQIKFQSSKPPVMIIFGLKDYSYRVIMG